MAQEQTEYPLVGSDKIYDHNRKVEHMNLWDGRIEMEGFVTPVMIRKGGAEIKKSCYDMMSTFHHNSCIRHLGFFIDAKNMGRLAIPCVGASFSNWVRDNREALINNGNMTMLFRTMIMDLCDVVKKLHDEKGIMIENLKYYNLYLAAEFVDNEHLLPRILLLITQAEYKQAVNNIELFTPIQKIIQWVYDTCNVQQPLAATRLGAFLLRPQFSFINLKNYPLDWDHRMKGEYMVSAMANKWNLIWNSMMGTGIFWPNGNGDADCVG